MQGKCGQFAPRADKPGLFAPNVRISFFFIVRLCELRTPRVCVYQDDANAPPMRATAGGPTGLNEPDVEGVRSRAGAAHQELSLALHIFATSAPQGLVTNTHGSAAARCPANVAGFYITASHTRRGCNMACGDA